MKYKTNFNALVEKTAVFWPTHFLYSAIIIFGIIWFRRVKGGRKNIFNSQNKRKNLFKVL